MTSQGYLVVDVPGEISSWLGLVGGAVQVDNVSGGVVTTTT